MTRLKILIGLLLVFLVALAAVYLLYFNRSHSSPNQIVQTTSGTTASSTTPPVATSTPSTDQLQLPAQEELAAKAADWPTYDSQEYKFEIKYPSGWEYWDTKTFPGGITGQTIYNATEIVRIASPVGVMSISYSEDLYKIPTQKSIIAHFEQDYNWPLPHQFKTFSLNGFEGAIGTTGDATSRGELGSAFRRIGNKVFYADWYLTEDYQSSGTSSYPGITYQNQFLPFLASFNSIQ